MGLCREFRFGGFGVEEESFGEFCTVIGLDVDEAFFGIVAVNVHDEVGGAKGESGYVCEENGVAVELDSESTRGLTVALNAPTAARNSVRSLSGAPIVSASACVISCSCVVSQSRSPCGDCGR